MRHCNTEGKGALRGKAPMRRIVMFGLYSLLLLVVGRNLLFLPRVEVGDKTQRVAHIKRRLETFLSKQKGVFSIYYKDLKTGQEFGINEHKVVTGASLNKLAIIAYLYHLAKDQKIDLEEKVVVQNDDIQDYGTGVLRYDGEGSAYTLKTLAQLALEKSDNTAAHILAVRLGVDAIQRYADELKMSSTNMVQNKTSAKDMGTLLSYMYTGNITDKALTAELLDFLKDTEYEDRLPRYLGRNAVIYHKTGDAVNMVHDVGIIDDGKESFILAVLSTDVVDEEETKVTIGKLAKLVYETGNTGSQ